MFCRHNWKVLDKTVVPSIMDIAMGLDATVKGARVRHLVRVYVLTVSCTVCGKLHTNKTHTYTEEGD